MFFGQVFRLLANLGLECAGVIVQCAYFLLVVQSAVVKGFKLVV